MITTPLSNCCKAAVQLVETDIFSEQVCTTCGKPCTVNTSAVEENWKDKIRRSNPETGICHIDGAEYNVSENMLINFICSISDSILREVLEDLDSHKKQFEGIDKKTKETTYSGGGVCRNCGKRQDAVEVEYVRDIITKRLEK